MKNYPPKWNKLTKAFKAKQKAITFGFKCKDGDVSRFAARYRLAISFQGIKLEGYSDKTIQGYNGLFKVFLSYSAYEQLNICINHKINHSFGNNSIENQNELKRQIIKFDKNQTFSKFILEKLDKEPLITNFKNYFNGDDVNVIVPAKAIRHIFAHGYLTPHAKSTLPSNTFKICSLISDSLFNIMNNELTERVKYL